MKQIRLTLKELETKTIPIGREGENDYTVVTIDCAEVFEKHPNAAATMRAQNYRKQIYPVTIVRDGNDIVWTVKDSDLTIKGDGRIQLTFTEGTIIHKTVIGRTLVLKSLVTNGTAPDPVQDWLDEAEDALEDLVSAEVHQPIIGEDGFWYKWNQEDGEYQKTNTKAQGEDGQDGHTPEKGVDYWTAADKAEMESDVAGAIIDDTAQAQNKTYSSSKIEAELTPLKSNLQEKPDVKDSTKTGVDLDVSDENGNVIVRLKDGHVQTKGFDSSKINMTFTGSNATADMDISDVNGNVVMRLADGHIKTKNFNSEYIRNLTGKKWVVIGDSLTEHNQRATNNYHDYIAEETGVTVVNLGRSGRGYAKEADSKTFVDVVASIPEDVDVITIFGSGNDNSSGLNLGTATDSSTTTICGCINATLDAIFASFPLVPLGIITPTPWENSEPSDGATAMSNYSAKIVEICALRGIPCLDLYHCSNLHPDDDDFRDIAYSRDDGNGVHPDENGHKFIAPRFRQFLFSLI